jgi:hypothetical protein
MRYPDKVNITVKFFKSPIVYEYYENRFRTRNYGAERAAEIYPILREEALNSLKGVFTLEEIELLIKILKSSIDRFEFSKEIFIQKIQEIMKLHTSLDEEEKKMALRIVEKIDKMIFFVAVIFSEWLCTYQSYSETYKGQKKNKISFKEYAKRLI